MAQATSAPTSAAFACRDLGVVLDFDNVTSPCTVPACVDRRMREHAVALLSAGIEEERTPFNAGEWQVTSVIID